MQADDPAVAVDERGDQGAGLEKLHAMVNKIGYPDKWRDYSSIEDRCAAISAGNVRRAYDLRIEPATAQDRQAGGSRRVGHDASDGERLLRAADERHQLSRPAFCSRRCSTPRWTTRRITAIPAPPSATS